MRIVRDVKGKQFVAVDYKGRQYDKFRVKKINGFWFGIVDRHQGEEKYYCTLKQVDSKSLGEVRESK